MRADEVKGITPYTRVVIGSPIYAGKWLDDAQELVKRFREELIQVQVAYFAVGILMVDDTPEHRRKVEAALDPVVKMVTPNSVGLFAGRLDPKDLSFPLRMVLKVMGTPEGDYRDWEGIRTWAKGLLA